MADSIFQPVVFGFELFDDFEEIDAEAVVLYRIGSSLVVIYNEVGNVLFDLFGDEPDVLLAGVFVLEPDRLEVQDGISIGLQVLHVGLVTSAGTQDADFAGGVQYQGRTAESGCGSEF